MNTLNTYALLIGINMYDHLPRLSRATIDVKDMHEVLTENGYVNAKVRMLIDTNATKFNISRELEWLAKIAEPDATVVLFFSGHGLQLIGGFWPGEYICPVNATFEYVRETFINSEELATSLRSIHAGRLAVFLDTCHAAGVGEITLPTTSIKAGLSETTIDNLGQASGRVIISSCRPGEESHELSSMRNGLFTHYLLEGLRGAASATDNAVYISGLFGYISRGMSQFNLQHPFIKSATEDFILARPQQNRQPSQIMSLIQTYYNSIIKVQKLVEEEHVAFKTETSIWPSQCTHILTSISTLSEPMSKLYQLLETTEQLPQAIHRQNAAILVELHSIETLVFNELEPRVKMFREICREMSLQVTRQKSDISEYLGILLQRLTTFDSLLASCWTQKEIQQHEKMNYNVQPSFSPRHTKQSRRQKTKNYSKKYVKPKANTISNISEIEHGLESETKTTLPKSKASSQSQPSDTAQFDAAKVDPVSLRKAMQSAYDGKELMVFCNEVLEKYDKQTQYDQVKDKSSVITILNIIKLSRRHRWYPKLVFKVIEDHPYIRDDLQFQNE